MPKKPPPNAFYFFMLDRKAAYERNGEKFPNGLKDVSVVAGPEWAVLPAAQRKKYEEMAKKEKARLKGDDSKKFTNMHNSFDLMNRIKHENDEKLRAINKNIEMTIRTLCDTKKIANFKFYLIHVNYYCISEGNCYHPAELAVSEFSLATGVSNVYHAIINVGRLPMGYRHDAQTRSDTVHQIPLENDKGESNYTMWKNVKDVLEGGRAANGGRYPPMYTMPDNVNLNTSISCVRHTVQMMCDSSACGDNPDDFPIYPLEKLFYELKLGCATIDGDDDITKYFPSVPYACSSLEDDVYNYTEDIACDFHIEIDSVVNCSKSFVQRWAYIVCDHTCKLLGIQLVPGKHVPMNSQVSFVKPKEPERKAGPSQAANKPFTFVSASGQAVKFASVEMENRPLASPTVQPTFVHPSAMRQQQNNVEDIDANFPSLSELSIGRGHGAKRPPRGGGRGGFVGGSRGPMSFSAAMQSKRGN